MNALTRSAASKLPRAVANTRAMSAAVLPKNFVQPSFAKTWLSDITTYPIMAIIVVANVGWTGFMTYKTMYCKNVRITSKTRGKVIRDW